ncbi:MAG: transcriptional repressor AgaR [Bacteroidota bacterium]
MKSTVERRDEIRAILYDRGKVRVDELSEQMGVTTVTIRNDLDFFEKMGILHRTHGGALLKRNVYEDPTLEDRQKRHQAEKRRIAREAVKRIRPGETILLDSGSTTLEIARHLNQIESLTVMTNSISIALELTHSSHLDVMLTGGTFQRASHSLVGPEAEATLSNYYFDKLFLGVDGIDPEFGLTTPNPLEAGLNRVMVRHARQVIAVTDSSKFGRQSFSLICEMGSIDTLITDKGLGSNHVEDLRQRKIDLVLV